MTEWRNFLQEGKYEAATTELTRMVMPHVKFIIDEVIPSENVQNSRKDLILVIGKKYLEGKGLPKELEKEMYMAELYFQKDSFNLALNGDGQYAGFLDVADDYRRKNIRAT